MKRWREQRVRPDGQLAQPPEQEHVTAHAHVTSRQRWPGHYGLVATGNGGARPPRPGDAVEGELGRPTATVTPDDCLHQPDVLEVDDQRVRLCARRRCAGVL